MAWPIHLWTGFNRMRNQHESTKLNRLRWATFSTAIFMGIAILGFFGYLGTIWLDVFVTYSEFLALVILGTTFGIPFIILGVTSLYWHKISICFSFGLFVLWCCVTVFNTEYPLWVLIIAFSYFAIGILNLLIWRTNSWDIVLNYWSLRKLKRKGQKAAGVQGIPKNWIPFIEQIYSYPVNNLDCLSPCPVCRSTAEPGQAGIFTLHKVE